MASFLYKLHNHFIHSFPNIPVSELTLFESDPFIASLLNEEEPISSSRKKGRYDNATESVEKINIIETFLSSNRFEQESIFKEWSQYLEEVFKAINNPISFFLTLDITSPIKFAGILSFLLKNGCEPQSLIKSGLLHRYFVLNCFKIEDVTKAYGILFAYDKSDSAKRLSGLASREGAFVRGFEQISLSGTLEKCLKKPKVKPSVFKIQSLSDHHYQS